MSFFQKSGERRKGELRIIGAISIDLNGVSEKELSRDLSQRSTRDKVVQTILKEFCSNSTVHGVRYFTEAKRHWSERIWWTIAFSLSLAMCITGIISIWDKWHRRPVIVSFNDQTTLVGLIPFPAVTICSTQKFTKDKIDVDRIIKVIMDMQNNASAFSRFSSEDMNHLDALMHVCSKEALFLKHGFAIPRTQSIYETIQTIGPDQSTVVIFATWLGQIAHFKPILTGEGLCYTFNSLNSRDIYTEETAPELLTIFNNANATYWSMENGYTTNVNESALYPFRVFGCGSHDSLSVVLNIYLDSSEYSEFCSSLAQGFHLSLHSPDELPKLPDEFIHVPAEQNIFISVKPRMITTSRGLRRYSPNLRGCYFKTGRHLRFFRLYSQQRCELECLANFTRIACDCVKFAMPRDKDTRVCTMTDIECYINAELEFKRNQDIHECACLPDCTAISYDVEISQAQFRYPTDEMELRSTINDSGFEAQSKLFITFKENNFIALNRTESYTIPDFIASCGGFLGLFMGISVLSVIELIYFFSLRLCCELKKRETTHIHFNQPHYDFNA